MATREQIMAALFALGQTVTWNNGSGAFLYTSRRVKLFSDVPSQPCLLQAEQDETYQQGSALPTAKRVLSASWIVYHQAGSDPDATPATTTNAIMDAIEAALQPTPSDPGYQNNFQTLGGLVQHVWITGKIFKAPGDIDGQGLLIVPLRLLIP